MIGSGGGANLVGTVASIVMPLLGSLLKKKRCTKKHSTKLLCTSSGIDTNVKICSYYEVLDMKEMGTEKHIFPRSDH